MTTRTLSFVRMWYTHQTRHEGGAATHLGMAGSTSNKTLCGITHPMMTSGEPFETFYLYVDSLSGECMRCQRAAIAACKKPV